MKTTPMLLAALLLTACHSQPDAENKQAAEAPVDPHFRAFIGKFRVLQLPLTIKLAELNDLHLPLLKGRDSNYIKSPYVTSFVDNLYAYGLLADTANNYKVIWLSPADYYVPVLTTFTKNGKRISEDYMGVGGCGSDCCFECDETVIVNKDLSIYSADSIKTCECGDNGPDSATMRRYANVKTAKIGNDGKFKFTDVKEVKY